MHRERGRGRECPVRRAQSWVLEKRGSGEPAESRRLLLHSGYVEQTSRLTESSTPCNSQKVEVDELGSLRPIYPPCVGGGKVVEYTAQAALPSACTEGKVWGTVLRLIY